MSVVVWIDGTMAMVTYAVGVDVLVPGGPPKAESKGLAKNMRTCE